MPLVLKKQPGETWRTAGARVAERHHMTRQYESAYTRYRERGEDQATAAWQALHDWDLLDYDDRDMEGEIEGALETFTLEDNDNETGT